MRKLLFLLLIPLVLTAIVSAQLGYNNPKLPSIQPKVVPTASVNNNSLNVNNTNCWLGICDTTALGYIKDTGDQASGVYQLNSSGTTLTLKGVADTVTPVFRLLNAVGTANLFSFTENFLGTGINVMLCEAPCGFATNSFDTAFTMSGGVVSVAVGTFFSPTGQINLFTSDVITVDQVNAVNVTSDLLLADNVTATNVSAVNLQVTNFSQSGIQTNGRTASFDASWTDPSTQTFPYIHVYPSSALSGYIAHANGSIVSHSVVTNMDGFVFGAGGYMRINVTANGTGLQSLQNTINNAGVFRNQTSILRGVHNFTKGQSLNCFIDFFNVTIALSAQTNCHFEVVYNEP